MSPGKGSLAHNFAAVSLALLVLAHSCQAAPPGAQRHNHHEPVWHRPCGTAVTGQHPAEHPMRHPKAKTVKAVRTKLGIAADHFLELERKLDVMYQEVKGVLKEEYRFSWLPQNQLQWFHREVKCLPKPVKMEKVLKMLHLTLQNYSATFEALKKIEQHVAPLYRDEILQETSTEVKNLLCEVETAIHNENHQIPDRLEADALFTDSAEWVADPDHTDMLIQDWGVLSRYQTFLDHWTIIMKEVTRTPASCGNGHRGPKGRRRPKHRAHNGR